MLDIIWCWVTVTALCLFIIMQCLDPSYYLLCCAGSMGCCFCVYLLMCHTSPCAVPVNKNKRCTNLQNILKPKWRDKLAWVCRKCANISTCMLHVIVLSKSMQQKYFLFCFEFDLLMVQPRLACDVIHMAATHAGSLCMITGVNEDHKKTGLWCDTHGCHTCWFAV